MSRTARRRTPTARRQSYRALLRDPRWQQTRLEIFEAVSPRTNVVAGG